MHEIRRISLILYAKDGEVKMANYIVANDGLIDVDRLQHYGVLGMKWGHRKESYTSTGVRSALARRANDKVDKSFKNWNENAKKKADAIELGKKAVASKLAYESNKTNKELKNQYKKDNKLYKKALKGNTTYRKGQIKNEVGSSLSRKYLSEAKKIKKQMESDPSNKILKKQYNDLMSKHDVERARARRAPEVAAKRSNRKAAFKRSMTMTIKAAAGTAAVATGAYLVNRYLGNHNVTLNGKRVIIGQQNLRDVANIAKKAKNFMGYMYY